ncbi:hypothetical protein KR200_010094 [Drosophila serrata]|nr:hypothetical protein KR200_010094 [Drosophila serrata]
MCHTTLGVGKTTLVRRICSKLSEKNHLLKGFYTEEVREDSQGQRIGFDVVTLTGKRGVLARITNPEETDKRHPKVGKYSVFVQEFENLALPQLDIRDDGAKPGLLVIDEVGKMEMFSKRFESTIDDLIQKKQIPLVITIPENSSLKLVERLRKSPRSMLFQVNKSNRDSLAEKIPDLITKSMLVT